MWFTIKILYYKMYIMYKYKKYIVDII